MNRKAYIIYCLVFLSLVPWLWMQFNQVLNGNILYLAITADKFLRTLDFNVIGYDINPPFNALIYAPASYISQFTSWPLYTSIYVYTLGMFAACSSILILLVNTLDTSKHQKIIICSSYMIANTVGAQFFFAEREYYIALVLPLLVLVQWQMLNDIKISKSLKYSALAISSFIIMLKPFFYVIPAIMIACRLMKHRKLSTLFKCDALYLSGFAFAYLIFSYTFFETYFTSTVPDIFSLYLGLGDPNVINFTLYTTLFGGILIGLSTRIQPPKERYFPILFFGIFILCLLPYAIQNKGYLYHLAPAATFLFVGISICILHCISGFLKRNGIKEENAKGLSTALSIVVLLIFSYKFLALPNQGITHTEYKNKEFVQILNPEHKETCSFFMFHDTMEIIYQLSVYSGCDHSSRFPTFWFLPTLLRQSDHLSEEDKKTLITKYAEMTAKDMERFMPEILLLGQFKIDGTNVFNFIDFFSQHSAKFERIINKYDHAGSKTINVYNYVKDDGFKDDIATYNIYSLKKVETQD